MKKLIQHNNTATKNNAFGKRNEISEVATNLSAKSKASSVKTHKTSNKADMAFAKSYEAFAQLKMALDNVYFRRPAC